MHIDTHIIIFIDLGTYPLLNKNMTHVQDKEPFMLPKNLRNCLLRLKKNETNTENIRLEVISYDLLTSQHDAPKFILSRITYVCYLQG